MRSLANGTRVLLLSESKQISAITRVVKAVSDSVSIHQLGWSVQWDWCPYSRGAITATQIMLGALSPGSMAVSAGGTLAQGLFGALPLAVVGFGWCHLRHYERYRRS